MFETPVAVEVRACAPGYDREARLFIEPASRALVPRMMQLDVSAIGDAMLRERYGRHCPSPK
jgi:hypothetical protein